MWTKDVLLSRGGALASPYERQNDLPSNKPRECVCFSAERIAQIYRIARRALCCRCCEILYSRLLRGGDGERRLFGWQERGAASGTSYADVQWTKGVYGAWRAVQKNEQRSCRVSRTMVAMYRAVSWQQNATMDSNIRRIAACSSISSQIE